MECNQEQLQHREGVQKQQCDRKSPRELQKLVPDQEVFQPQRCNRVQLKLSGGSLPTHKEQLENNQDTSYQPITPMATPQRFLPSGPPQTPHKPDQPTGKCDSPPMTIKGGRVIRKPPKLDL